jgi:hypothetical protein
VSARLVLEIETRPFERLDADVAVAGVCTDDRPLRGGAARADWRLCGLISRLLQEERLSGEAGEALLVPSDGRLRAPRVLIVGLGPRRTRPTDAVRDLLRDALDRVLGLGLASAAIGPIGFTGDAWSRHAQAVVDAGVGAVEAADRPLALRLAVSSQAEARLRASIGAVVDALGHPAVEIVRREDRRTADAPVRRRPAPQGSPPIHRFP